MSTRSAAKRQLTLLSSASSRRFLHASTSRCQAAPVTASEASPSTDLPPSTASSTASTAAAGTSAEGSTSNRIISSLIVSRPPVILRDPTKFETAYFEYNRRLSEALQQPFPKDFYFKKGSAAEKRFDEEQASASLGFSGIPGPSSSKSSTKTKGAKGKESGAASASSASSSSTSGAAEGEIEAQPLPRITESDTKNDTKSLVRKLDRTLYLVVKQKSSQGTSWAFPSKLLSRSKKENLHDAAPNAVKYHLGEDMDLWMISHLPVGLFRSAEDEKTYFMRAHILAGNAKLAKEEGRIEEFQWLTKEEIEKVMQENQSTAYWQNVQDLLDP